MSKSSSSSSSSKVAEKFARSSNGYVPIGKMYNLKGSTGNDNDKPPLPIYVVGDGNKSSKRCLLILSDVYGIHTGRHKVVADTFATECGYYVVMPDLFRNDPPFIDDTDNKSSNGNKNDGKAFDPTIGSERLLANYKYSQVEHDLIDIVLPFIRHQTSGGSGCKISIVGFCYGAYVMTYLATEIPREELVCCVSSHPSIVQLSNVIGDDWKTAFETLIQCPMLLINAENDKSVEQQPNGEISQLLSGRNLTCDSQFHTFTVVKHGFSIRGDIESDAVVKEATQVAFQLMIEFLTKQFDKKKG